jgi:hypothetical protein
VYPPLLFNTLETVAIDTPAWVAMSLMVGICFPPRKRLLDKGTIGRGECQYGIRNIWQKE